MSWIKLSEKMPDDKSFVIFADFTDGEFCGMVSGGYSEKYGIEIDGSIHAGGGDIYCDLNFTHWQPLPESPQGK